MIGFVIWPPILFKGGQMTKPIIVVKIACELAIVYPSSKWIFNKKFCSTYNHLATVLLLIGLVL